MVYRKGELSPAGVDRGWPHQVVPPESTVKGPHYNVVRGSCREHALSLCDHGHAVFHEGQGWNVFYFAEPEHAEAFRVRFAGTVQPARPWPGRGLDEVEQAPAGDYAAKGHRECPQQSGALADSGD